MINFYNQVPLVYTHASRDFQFISWLVNIVLNSVKHNIDDMYDLPNNKADARLIELFALTLGFKIKRNYDQKQLATLASIIPTILKYKGSKKAIDLAGIALIRAAGLANSVFKSKLVDNCLEIVLPQTLVDTTLFMDLLPYILPAGLTCKVVRSSDKEQGLEEIEVAYQDALLAEWYSDIAWDDTYVKVDETTKVNKAANHTAEGLSGLFDVGNAEPNFTGFTSDSTVSSLKLNTGLLDNTIIPDVVRSHGSFIIEDSTYAVAANNYGSTVIMNGYSTEENEQGTTVIAAEEGSEEI